MPLPLLAWGAVALATVAAHEFGRNTGKKQGYKRGKEEARAEIQRLRALLSDAQIKREEIKMSLQTVVNNVSEVDLKDNTFFAKIMAFFKGYTNFHIFTVCSLAHAKYRTLEIALDEGSTEELRSLVLGVVHIGFPRQMQQDLKLVWDMTSENDVANILQDYSQRLSPDLQTLLSNALKEIDEIVQGLKALDMQQVEYLDGIREVEEYLESA